MVTSQKGDFSDCLVNLSGGLAPERLRRRDVYGRRNRTVSSGKDFLSHLSYLN